MSKAKTYRILILPSGGATGIIPSLLLSHLEEKTGMPIYRLFDEIWGSSIGAMTAALLTTPKQSSPAQIQEKDLFIQHEPRSAAEIAQFIKNTFSCYHHAAGILKTFKTLVDPSTKLKDTLIPIRILSAKVTEWAFGYIPKKLELTPFCNKSDGNLSLTSIVCGSCSNPPIHRTEPLTLSNGARSYLIDAGHEFCGRSSCMNPLFLFMNQFSQEIDLERESVSLYFLSNGWVNLPHSMGTQGKVIIPVNEAQSIPVNLFNVRVELDSAFQKWKRTTWTGQMLCSIQSDYLLLNLAGIGAIPISLLAQVAEEVANTSVPFRSIVSSVQSLSVKTGTIHK